jgi:hypothetical protein
MMVWIEQYMQWKYKFKEFNAEVDMAAPKFKIGTVFSSMSEFTKALNAYSVNERVKIRKLIRLKRLYNF